MAIEAFGVGAKGVLSARRLFCQADHGDSDGFAADPRGWVWATAADGVRIVAPDRARLGYIPTRPCCMDPRPAHS